MVDLDAISLEELSALVTRYPWFGAARKALCCRTGQYAKAALYVFDRSILASLAAKAGESPAPVPEFVQPPMEQKVVVLGGDYFSQDAYDSVRAAQEEGKILRSAQDDRKAAQDDRKAAQEDRKGAQDDRKAAQEERKKDRSIELDDVFYTEPLAEIYATQGYLEQAKNIYSKLMLRYPEKSAYFATLIEKLNNINNQ